MIEQIPDNILLPGKFYEERFIYFRGEFELNTILYHSGFKITFIASLFKPTLNPSSTSLNLNIWETNLS